MSLKDYWKRKIAPELRQLEMESADTYHRLIVELSGNEIYEILAIVKDNRGKLYQKMNIVSTLVVEVPFPAIEALARSKQVKRIWRDNKIKIC